MEAPFEKNFISTKEAGELSGYTADYLARLARAGSVRSERIGRAWLIDRASLEAFITQQGNRKIDRARALARTREQEYRAAQSPVRKARETVSQISSSVSHRLTKPLSVPELPFAQGALRTHAVALLVALAVVGSGFGVARAATLPQLGAEALALAAETASGFSAAFGNIPAQIAANVTGARGATSAEQIRVRSEIADATAQIPPIAEPHMELALSGMHFGSPASAVQTSAYAFATATPVTFADIASAAASAAAFVSSPTAIGDALLGGYYAAGGAAYEAIRAAQGGYLALIERAGAQALAFGASSRDTLAASPRAISGMNLALGNAVIDGTHAAIGAEVALVYGSVRTAPVVAEASVAFVGGTGTALADAAAGAARGGASATLALLGSAHAAAPALARAVWSTE